jgi:DNA-binding beta-propeller fold protein YncE
LGQTKKKFRVSLWWIVVLSASINSCAAQEMTASRTLHEESAPTEAAARVWKGTGYHIADRFSVGGEDEWDDLTIDTEMQRLYVSHSDNVEVLDVRSGRSVGRIEASGVTGIAISKELHRGFTSNRDDNSVTIFDTRTLSPLKKVALQTKAPDFILYDSFSKRVFPFMRDTTVLDGHTGEIVGILRLGELTEDAVSDGKGKVYVNLRNGTIAVVNPLTLAVTATFKTCSGPKSLSYDPFEQRLFVGCPGELYVQDATTGKIVGWSVMCGGVDGVGFDAESGLIFESCGEGVLSIIHQTTSDRHYQLVETIPTGLKGAEMAFDPETKRIYIPTVQIETTASADLRKPWEQTVKHRSFCVLVLARE